MNFISSSRIKRIACVVKQIVTFGRLTGHLVAAFVFGMAVVAFDPFKFDHVRFHGGKKSFPEVDVLDGRFVGFAPVFGNP